MLKVQSGLQVCGIRSGLPDASPPSNPTTLTRWSAVTGLDALCYGHTIKDNKIENPSLDPFLLLSYVVPGTH